MKLTCLTKGSGFHFPPCHLLNVCGFRILVDCPLDLSALVVFSPIPVGPDGVLSHETSDEHLDSTIVEMPSLEKRLEAKDLIYAQPWYKMVNSLHLWDTSFIDIVLISSPMGMLGLPFLTRNQSFSAKIYATEAATRIGQLLMEDLVSMHMEIRQFYGPEEGSLPELMRVENLEALPSSLRKIISSEGYEELGAWLPLYTAGEIKDCTRKIQTLKYAEEVCYNGTVVIEAFSSGLEIGSCNWTINSPKRSMSFISRSVFGSTYAMNFNWCALQGSEQVIYSDFSPLDFQDQNAKSTLDPISATNLSNLEEIGAYPLIDDENSEELEKLTFICTCAIDSVKSGGSVLIPIGQLGILLQLLEQMSALLEASVVDVPINIISSIAVELMAYTDIIPEWLCKKRQEKLSSGESVFAYANLIAEKKINVFPAVHSPKLLTNWQEPCIVFCPHWSLRLGPVVHLLRRWRMDENSLLVLEVGVDSDIALLPFKPMAMKVLKCSFLSGIRLELVQPLVKLLQPKQILFPEDLRCEIKVEEEIEVFHYSENKTLRIPSTKNSMEVEMSTSELHWKTLKEERVWRLNGELTMERGKIRITCESQLTDPSRTYMLHCGVLSLERLLNELSKMGIEGSIEPAGNSEEPENTAGTIRIWYPEKAFIRVEETKTLVTAADEKLASQIFEAINIVLDAF